MGYNFEQHRRSILHKAVHGLLNEVAVNLESSFQVAEVIEAVHAIVQGACAEFSETWNGRHARSLARQLPVEVMTECLLVSDFTTRVRASHVSRRWRAVALADCRLWTNFRIARFSSAKDEHVALERLEHMMQRSRPLPIRLQIPRAGFSRYYYALHVLRAIQSDMHRLVDYEGPGGVFQETVPLPNLVSVNCLGTGREMPSDNDVLRVRYVFPAAANLRRLHAPLMVLLDAPGPYQSLQHLVCHLRRDVECEHLFQCFPNLITVEFRGIQDDTLLPPGPLPPTLQHITLRVPEVFLETADFGVVLQPWSSIRIPRLDLFRADDVEPLIPIFLASHSLPVKLTTYFDDSDADIVLTSVPELEGEIRWEIGTHGVWEGYDCFRAFRTLCAERLTALSIPLSHFWACCDVQTQAPHLTDLEIRLAGREEVGSPWDGPEQGFYLRAPKLRRVVIGIEDSFRDHTMPIHETTIFDTLDDDFRSLIVYDAELLDGITVHCAALHLDAFSCHDFARFAKMYSVDSQ